MLRFVADENFDNDILRGLARWNPRLDVVRVQDVGLMGVPDPDILEWAAREGRLLLTHDVATVTKYAHDRVAHGLAMPGVMQVASSRPIGPAIEDLLLLAECSREGEWANQVLFLPL